MGSGFSQCFCPQKSYQLINPSIITISQKTTTLVPDFNSQNDQINSLTSIFVTNLINEAETKLNSHEHNKSINLLLRATQLGSASAATKLGTIYLNGIDNDSEVTEIAPDYVSAATYYFIALKLTLMIPYASWDIELILDTVSALTKLYCNQLGNPNNLDILNHGVKLMGEIDKNLQDTYFMRIFSYKQTQRKRASRIHINYCHAITAESKGDLLEALKGFEECELIGQCGIESADKLIKKANSSMQRLDNTRPKVQPICVQCNFEAKDLNDIWNLLICTRCKKVACCRECLDKHIIGHLNRRK
ncbi:5759_t:CDS:1 [Funneliformis geosporum]|uniref:2955_t:CDS:1 n=1 Tax=Funneliformis geosporum TaxID=1117311 RepID=A0A9W4WVA3_9GLOM|nr:5759_t:CDS:1 [Funneliformis geosporum]CAI2166256.1 2955_t:CDS:1 [Funneliformis geosporum]